ncbi:MAG: hypothetical protein CMF74_04265 [Maricaulis sp.]|jgi:secreted PhoX family phosphatase|nr:hypothetical protein [Maricaulis sp.]
MPLSRRHFLRNAAATTTAFAGLAALAGCGPRRLRDVGGELEGYGPLYRDPGHLLDLPRGFSYQVISTEGEEMSDGLITPGDFDGMACFEREDGRIALIRNHELHPGQQDRSPFGPDNERLERIAASRLYDRAPDGTPLHGGTTTLVLNPDTLAIERQFLSLGGTHNNCAGGPTPWGSWLTCEETTERAGERMRRDHGYVFEVPSSANELVEAVPLRGLGRFRHEAAAIDPVRGIVYLTEDAYDDALFYRFLPDQPGELWRGGRLQALAIRGRPGFDTRNWSSRAFAPGEWLDTEWIDIVDTDNPDGDMALRHIAIGAAHFTRGEGAWFGEDEVYFTCTDGGSLHSGQIFRYVHDGSGGRIQLFHESDDTTIMDHCDNLTIAPWGDLIIAEDGPSEQYIRGVTPEGRVYTIARNAFAVHSEESDDTSYSEFCGPCFSPDGSVLFLNVQSSPSRTLAIRGPWQQRSLEPRSA